MNLVTPQLGLFFWTVVIFLTVFFILRKFAWKPILKALAEREQGIAESLAAAQKARDDMQKTQADNERVLAEARKERTEILAEANKIKDKIVAEARDQASKDLARKLAEAEQQIANAKQAALNDIKNQAGKLALDVAEKLLRKQLAADAEQQRLVQEAIADFKLN